MNNGSVFLISGRILILMLILLFLFHILMIAGALPSGMVWGGTAAGSSGNLLVMESISLVITLLFILVAAGRCSVIRLPVKKSILKAGLWVMFVYFMLNLAGNLASDSSAERNVFVPVSLILALLSFLVAVTGKE